jgi:two-component system, chemotaxis family, protein-glutamate methylesterase/glutaminase
MGASKIKVLIVEDSVSVQILLEHILESDPEIEICGKAFNGKQALSVIKENRPDIITMDMSMPVLNGEETTRIIMQTDPIPILVITASLSVNEVKNSYRALAAGALKVMNKPLGLSDENYKEISAEIIQSVKNLSKIKLVKRKNTSKRKHIEISNLELLNETNIQHIAIGASTGGPTVILDILQKLPGDFKVPIYIVQHIARGFLDGFVAWLRSSTNHDILITEHGKRPLPGKIYIAANNFETGIAANGLFELRKCSPGNLICPSISFLFKSLAENFGQTSAGILLTGMGKDGAAELLEMRHAGAITIAQNEESSVIFGMPGEANKIGAASYVLCPGEIVQTLKNIIY